MSRFVRRVILPLALLTGLVFAGLWALLPKSLEVRRSIAIAVPPPAIHEVIARLSSWPDWTAWNLAREPTLELSFSGPESGVGASLRFAGGAYGRGSLRLTASDPDSGIRWESEIEDGALRGHGGIELRVDGGIATVVWKDSLDLMGSFSSRLAYGFMRRRYCDDIDFSLARLRKRLESPLFSRGQNPERGPAPAASRPAAANR